MGFSRILIGWKRWGNSFGQSLEVDEMVREQGEETKIRERVKLLIRRYETMMMLKYPAEGNLLPDQEYPAFGVLHGCGTVKGIINRAV